MRIRLTADIATCEGRFSAGDEIDAPEQHARSLIESGNAVAIESAAVDPRERTAVRCIDASPRPAGINQQPLPSSP